MRLRAFEHLRAAILEAFADFRIIWRQQQRRVLQREYETWLHKQHQKQPQPQQQQQQQQETQEDAVAATPANAQKTLTGLSGRDTAAAAAPVPLQQHQQQQQQHQKQQQQQQQQQRESRSGTGVSCRGRARTDSFASFFSVSSSSSPSAAAAAAAATEGHTAEGSALGGDAAGPGIVCSPHRRSRPPSAAVVPPPISRSSSSSSSSVSCLSDVCVAVHRYGSFPLLTYLPDGDLDVGVLMFSPETGRIESEEDSEAFLMYLLFRFRKGDLKTEMRDDVANANNTHHQGVYTQQNPEAPHQGDPLKPPRTGGPQGGPPKRPPRIRNAHLIKADVKIVKLQVDDLAVDLSVNKVRSL